MKFRFKFLFLMLAFFLPALSYGMSLRLTGDTVPSTYAQERLNAELSSLYGPKVIPPSLPNFTLFPYQKKELSLSFHLPHGQSMPLHLEITGEKIPRLGDPLLLFSDHPETVLENGLLFSAGIIFLRPVRLNYYHQNAVGSPPRAMVIRIDNPSHEPAIIHVIEAKTNPSKNEIGIGHQTSFLFLTRRLHGLGYIKTIPPKSFLILSRQIALSEEVVTGLFQMTELQGHPLGVSVLARDPNIVEQSQPFQLESRDTHARGAYELSNLSLQTKYCAGNQPKIIALGDLRLKNLLPGKPLKGSYGMIWEGDIVLCNPFLVPEDVPIYFQPRGGTATATLIINGFVKEEALTEPYEKALLFTFHLPPASEKLIHFMTMPEGGSSYPIYLIVGKGEPL